MTGLLGFSSGYYAMMKCKTLLMIGTDFPYQQFFPNDAVVIQIDIRGEQLGRRTKVDHGLVGDTKATLSALLPHLKQSADDDHLKSALEHYRKARQGLDELATESRDPKGSHPQFVTRVLNELAAEDAIFTCDVGTPTVWAARYLTMNGKRRLLGSFVHGSMANALPQAIGAQLARQDRQIISMFGRRRCVDVARRSIDSSSTEPSGKSRCLQKRFALVRRIGDESQRLPRFRRRAQES